VAQRMELGRVVAVDAELSVVCEKLHAVYNEILTAARAAGEAWADRPNETLRQCLALVELHRKEGNLSECVDLLVEMLDQAVSGDIPYCGFGQGDEEFTYEAGWYGYWPDWEEIDEAETAGLLRRANGDVSAKDWFRRHRYGKAVRVHFLLVQQGDEDILYTREGAVVWNYRRVTD
jgi:hypothetical protein